MKNIFLVFAYVINIYHILSVSVLHITVSYKIVFYYQITINVH